MAWFQAFEAVIFDSKFSLGIFPERKPVFSICGFSKSSFRKFDIYILIYISEPKCLRIPKPIRPPKKLSKTLKLKFFQKF